MMTEDQRKQINRATRDRFIDGLNEEQRNLLIHGNAYIDQDDETGACTIYPKRK